MYNPLLSYYTHDFDTLHTTIPQMVTAEGLLTRKHLFHLPLPISPLDEVVMKLISMFLLYSMIALSTMFSSHAPELGEVSAYLAEHGNFDVWIQRCSDLPYEYRDSLCTRAYSALSKSLEADASPSPSLTIKFYSLRCLLPTSSSVIKPDTFWDQARKFSLLCMKATHNNEAQTAKNILAESSRLITEVQRRADKDSFLTASSFFKLCDYLSMIAAQVFALVTMLCYITESVDRERDRSRSNLCLRVFISCWLRVNTIPRNDWSRDRRRCSTLYRPYIPSRPLGEPT